MLNKHTLYSPMTRPHYSNRAVRALFALVLSFSLAACGGGASIATPVDTTPTLVSAEDSTSPRLSGNTAIDGLNWINYRRQQAGVPALERNARLETAAQGQSNDLQLNKVVS